MRTSIESSRAARTEHSPVTCKNTWLLSVADGCSQRITNDLQSIIIERSASVNCKCEASGTEPSGRKIRP